MLASAVACAAPEVSTPTTSSRPDQGVLFFHRYSNYGAWDAQLLELDLASGALTDLSAEWMGVRSPINAHASADGQWLTFMASDAGLAEPEWDVYVSRWDGSGWAEPVNLTGPNGRRDEDPKFASAGQRIAYKQDGVLAIIDASGGAPRLLTPDQPTSSMPYFTVDGEGLVFERGGAILLWREGNESTLWPVVTTKAYYPIVVDAERFLFTEVQASRHDRIMWGRFDGAAAVPLFSGSDQCDNSDPFPYQDASRFVFYVTGCPVVLKGGYNLVYADRSTRTVHDLDTINPEANSHLEELGPAWSAVAPFPQQP